LLEYFSVGHPKFNAFTVKIVKSIVSSREVDLDELSKLQVIEKINGIMSSVMSNNQEWCSDHLLEIMNEILHQAAELKKNDNDSVLPQQVYDQQLINFKAFMKLLIVSDIVRAIIIVISVIEYCREG
jgi:hypothetical protein